MFDSVQPSVSLRAASKGCDLPAAPAPHINKSIQVSMAIPLLRVLPGCQSSYGTQTPKISLRVKCDFCGTLGNCEHRMMTEGAWKS
jgi:hypothetical protein